MEQKRFMIAAMSSGSGKTVMTCGLMQAFSRRGMTVEGLKCGPDYIDPMFHHRVLGIPSRNLDLYLQGDAGVARTLGRQQAALAIIEGAMGFYDGLNGTTEASAWAVADAQNIPVVLVVRPQGSSITLAVQIRGLMEFRNPSHIAGVLLTDCKPMLYAHLRPILEQETGLPVLGYLPPMEEAHIPSRHLGLITAAEIADLSARFDAIAAELERHMDLDGLLALAAEIRGADDLAESWQERMHDARSLMESERIAEVHCHSDEQRARDAASNGKCHIAVAMDEAFSFYYQDNLDLLSAAGAELIYFSPLHDAMLPEVDGLYLGGGYPELHLETLSANETMRASIQAAIECGIPTVAECGGFLYLQQALQDDQGTMWPMAGVLPGTGYRTDRLQRFGYLTLTGEQDSLLLRAGETVPAHEFHYWDVTDCGTDLQAEKASGKTWRCGYAGRTLYAAFPHMHWGGEIPMAERFARAAAAYRQERCGQNSGDIGS